MSETARFDSFANVKCPGCGALIPISEALQRELVEQADEKARAAVAQRERSIAERESALAARASSLEEAEARLEARVEERLAALLPAVEEKARTAAATELELELRDARAEAEEKARRIAELQEKELALRGEKRALEEERQALELDLARRLDAERAKIRDDALAQSEEAHRLRDAEREMKLQEALRMNQELQRKLQQGSQQTQGEALEIALEELLRESFPLDEIEPVAKGVRGADVLQRVRARSGAACGAILWESKNAKHWSPAWIAKLKDDQREARADLAILVSTALPKDVVAFGPCDGVWVAEPRVAVALATALRTSLVDLATARRAAAGRNELRDALFDYVTGPEFRQRVEAIVRTFAAMQADLEEEKRAASRRWAKREKQLARVAASTSAFYGDLEGLLGPSLPPVPALGDGDDADEEGSLDLDARGGGSGIIGEARLARSG
jgi:hypothetical protein